MRNRLRGYDSLFLQKVESAVRVGVVLTLANTCIDKGVPIADLADMLGVTRATAYNWITGRTVPRPRYLALMPKIILRLSKRK